MGKQIFNRTKKTLAISLLVLFVMSLTAASVSAEANAAFNGFIKSTTKDDNDQCTTYTVRLDAINNPSYTYKWDFGDGTSATEVSQSFTHKYKDCTDHTITLTVIDSSDNTEATDTLTI